MSKRNSRKSTRISKSESRVEPVHDAAPDVAPNPLPGNAAPEPAPVVAPDPLPGIAEPEVTSDHAPVTIVAEQVPVVSEPVEILALPVVLIGEPDAAPVTDVAEPVEAPTTQTGALVPKVDLIVGEPEIVESLSPAEMDALVECERTIARGLRGFYEAGLALMKVQEDRLYRADYPTFDHYLDERWGLSHSRGYQLIDASKVVIDLRCDPELESTIVEGLNEAQARELAKVKEPEQRREVARQVLKEEGKITARKFADAVTARTGKAVVSGSKGKGMPGDRHEPEPLKVDTTAPRVTASRPLTVRVDRPEPASKAASRPREPYLREEHPLTEAIRDLFGHSLVIPSTAQNSVERLLASDPTEVSLDDLDTLIRRCGLGVLRIVMDVPAGAQENASA